MDLPAFRDSLQRPAPPAGLTPALQALWWDAKGDWDKAHHCVDHEDGKDAARVHAYLHRKEGDQANAGYWYSTAGAAPFKGALDAEWAELVAARLK
ncbi:MAG TPA: hypothetical protein VHA35_01880 [Dongiaceae bacterium]|jgi:hypothetical protein|nr:hypothetical protein [Dongiaceae bacterium]